MATTSIIKIDGMAIYSHWDGYPQGMAAKLYEMINHQYHQRGKIELQDVGYINAFISANITNCRITTEEYSEYANFKYEINSKNNTISTFKLNFDNDKMEYIETLSLFSFLRKYFKSDDENEKVIYEIKDDYRKTSKIFTQKVFKEHIIFLKERVKEFKPTNPNRKVALDELKSLRVANKFYI